MKRLLPIILATLLIAVPVTANPQYRLIVNDKILDKPAIVVDGVSYAPVRALADAFDSKTEWNEERGIIEVKREVRRPPISGDAEFVAKINAALDLLEEKDFPHYVMVCEYTHDIAPLLIDNPAETIKDSYAFNIAGATRIMPKIINDPQRYAPLYLAGVLVHEACHATTSKYDVPGTEKDAYAHELAALKLLDAPYWMQEECMNRE